jgi:hypothetical protein
MHAGAIVQRFIETHLVAIHAARRGLLSAVVAAAMRGQCLSLTRLSRGLLEGGCLKAAIKRVDRLIGHTRIGQEAHIVGAALLGRLCRMGSPLVIAVDWSAVSPGGQFVELRAAVTWLGMGRALTVYQQVYPLCMLGNGKAERALLEMLRAWVPAEVEVVVVVVTDAGFRRPWFAQVERLGWSWIGRVRQGVCVSRDGQRWLSAGAWFGSASRRAKRWSGCYLSKKAALPCDMVLYRCPARGRKSYRCPGHGSTPKAAREARQSAQEPWLLAHSTKLSAYRPDEIVAMYARRMHIEESFRDSKSAVYGMGLEIGRSRSALRLHALLLIATLAAFLLWHIGQLAEAEGLHRRFKATTRAARELSVITLAILLCAQALIPLTTQARTALEQRLGVRL